MTEKKERSPEQIKLDELFKRLWYMILPTEEWLTNFVYTDAAMSAERSTRMKLLGQLTEIADEFGVSQDFLAEEPGTNKSGEPGQPTVYERSHPPDVVAMLSMGLTKPQTALLEWYAERHGLVVDEPMPKDLELPDHWKDTDQTPETLWKMFCKDRTRMRALEQLMNTVFTSLLTERRAQRSRLN